MTLIEAYRNLGPIVGDAQLDAVRSEAAATILGAVRAASRPLRFPVEVKEEAEARVVLKLVQRAVNGAKWNDPDTDGAVRAWLHRCLYNEGVSLLRQRDQQLPEGGEHGLPEPHAAPDESASDELAAAVWHQLEHEVLPSAAASMRGQAGEGLARAFHEMRALALGQASIAGVVEASGKPPGAASEAAVHKQHQRARDRLLSQVEAMEARAEVERQRAEHLRNAVRSLRRRA